MKYIPLLLFLLAQQLTHAQTVQWASRLVDFSSEYTKSGMPLNTTRYKASQLLGVPNTLVYGISELAWAPGKSQAGKESVTVEFPQPQYVQQVIIGETYNPGAVQEIILYDEKGNGHTVYQNKNTYIKNNYGQVLIGYKITPTNYTTRRLKLILNTDKVGGMQQIDCIGISTNTAPVKLTINELKYSEPIADPQNLGKNVNSEYFDHLPLISPDGTMLLFTRKFAEQNIGEAQKDDIYFSHQLPGGTFSKAQNIGSPLNNEEHNFVCYIGADNNTLYLANKYKGSNLAGVSVSHRQKDQSWSKPKALNIPDMYNNNEFVHYHFSLDEKTLLMSVQRNDSYGDLDLYVSFQYADGTWSVPKNLGPVINTVGAEGSVFLAADGKTLYFSSTGQQGYGSYDMFMTKRLDNTWTNWSKPLNLGPKINSPEMDIYYTIAAAGDYAYFSSGRTIYGLNDLYRIRLPKEARPEPVNLATAPLKKDNTPINSSLDDKLATLKTQQTSKPTTTSQVTNSTTNKTHPASAPPPTTPDDLDKKLEALKQQQKQAGNPMPTKPVTAADDPAKQTFDNLSQQKTEPPATFSWPAVNSTSQKPAEQQSTIQQQTVPQQIFDVQTQEATQGTKLPAPDPYYQKPALKEKQNDQFVQEYSDMQDQINALKQQQQQQTFHGDAPKTGKIKVDTANPAIKYIPPTPAANTTAASSTNPEILKYEEKLKHYQDQLASMHTPQNTAIAHITPVDQPLYENKTGEQTSKPSTPETTIANTEPAPVSQKNETELNNNLNSLNDSKTALENDISALTEQRDKINADKNKLSTENEQLASEKAKLEADKKKMDELLAQMQAEKLKLEQEKLKMEAEKAKLEALKKQQEKEFYTLKSAIDSLKNVESQTAEAVSQKQRFELFDMPIEVGAVAVMSNIYFVADAAFIQKQSYPELDKLVNFMKQNNTLKVEIGGHTNGLCDDVFCNKLSNDRSKSIVDYLVSKGIDIKKLTYKGYGKQYLISKPGDAINQRVEIKILSLQ